MKFLTLLMLLISFNSFAGPGKVGNGDDGSDLEGYEEITSGKIFKTRKLAVSKLEKLNIMGIPGLGGLLPEVKNTRLYITKRNISAKKLEELGAFHSGIERYIYARTMPEPYAATRFFPVSLDLTESQLIALHIHEGLHRSLEKRFRENEELISKLTLAITAPGASHDSIASMAKSLLTSKEKGFLSQHKEKNAYLEARIIKHASSSEKNGSPDFAPLNEIYGVSSKVYPLSNKFSSVGLGIDLSYFKNDEESFLGPLGILVSGQVFTVKGFKGELFAKWGRNSGSSKILKNALVARDNFRVGIELYKFSGSLEIQNLLEFQKAHKETKTFSGQAFNFDYGSVTRANIILLKRLGKFAFGSGLALHLIGPTEVTGGLVSKAERGTILALRPKLRYQLENHQVFLELNIPLSINDSNFNNIGDFREGGLTQNRLSLSYRFLF